MLHRLPVLPHGLIGRRQPVIGVGIILLPLYVLPVIIGRLGILARLAVGESDIVEAGGIAGLGLDGLLEGLHSIHIPLGREQQVAQRLVGLVPVGVHLAGLAVGRLRPLALARLHEPVAGRFLLLGLDPLGGRLRNHPLVRTRRGGPGEGRNNYTD
jgi:hypothetical protein